MHIILTHEQADFDALASLLGAHLLNEHAIPILPRRMNRNVKAFLTLYGAELPFVDPRDLNGELIEFVTLVDTQSMVSIKGITEDTVVQVIDHHDRRENIPADWSLTTVDVGATTTLLVEALREQGEPLNTVQATLLLLGIYEDTGSLTYTRTTSRDLQAAAYLLDQGASLQIANDFLNHPLSLEQQSVYDQLRQTAEYHTIRGHTIIIATGNALNIKEELSSIAHKLRDLLDPDALILLLETRGGVQLIARSTSDHIDVSEIAARFGGGGHARASAGLIRDRDIADIRQELNQILPNMVRPAITVSQIMSRGPQVLKPETPVEEAAQRMRRYGYEGYPVVNNGQVVGLLTRRAVDRALSHKLNLTAASLMDAGTHTVTPDDSLEQLQRVMTDSGWGQVPVVDPQSGQIVGIVTRTDLLKTLTQESSVPGRENLAEKLNAALPKPRLEIIQIMAAIAHELQAALYLVGGFVRDLLLDRPSLDFDFVVEGDAILLAHTLARRHGGRVTAHSRFGTAKWHLPASYPMQSVDLITARTEFYTHPTALPTVERGSIKLDLHRRDFTINTLALRLDGAHYGELHDYWGGLSDLRQGLVRVLHSLSFVDDPTRMLRAARFEQRFGFKIEDRTLELLIEARPLLDRVSGDRIRHELEHILVEEKAPQILARLNELQLLRTIHPALTWDTWLESRLEAIPTKRPDVAWGLSDLANSDELKQGLAYCLWLLRLPTQQAASVARRLKMTAKLTETVLAANRLWQNLAHLIDSPPSRVVAELEEVPALSRYAVYLATSDIHLRKIFLLYATQWQHVTPKVSGHDLRKRGLPPGPAYRRILAALRSAWLDGQISTPEEEEKLLEELITQEHPQND